MALRPLSIGEIVDRSTSLWRSNWKALFQLLLGFQLVQYISLKSIELLIDRTLPAAKNPAQALELMKADPSTWLPQLWPIAISVMIVVLVNFFVSQVAGVAISAFVFPRLTNAPAPSIGDAMRLAVRKLGPPLGCVLTNDRSPTLPGTIGSPISCHRSTSTGRDDCTWPTQWLNPGNSSAQASIRLANFRGHSWV